MKVLVCGGRDYADREAVAAVLKDIHLRHGISVVIEGGATGADRLAAAAGPGLSRSNVKRLWIFPSIWIESPRKTS